MKLLIELFSSNSGRMSIAGIAFMIGMGIFFILYFRRKMAEDTRAAELRRASAAALPGSGEQHAPQ